MAKAGLEWEVVNTCNARCTKRELAVLGVTFASKCSTLSGFGGLAYSRVGGNGA